MKKFEGISKLETKLNKLEDSIKKKKRKKKEKKRTLRFFLELSRYDASGSDDVSNFETKLNKLRESIKKKKKKLKKVRRRIKKRILEVSVKETSPLKDSKRNRVIESIVMTNLKKQEIDFVEGLGEGQYNIEHIAMYMFNYSSEQKLVEKITRRFTKCCNAIKCTKISSMRIKVCTKDKKKGSGKAWISAWCCKDV